MGIYKHNRPDLGNNGHCFAPKLNKMSQNCQPQQTRGLSMLVALQMPFFTLKMTIFALKMTNFFTENAIFTLKMTFVALKMPFLEVAPLGLRQYVSRRPSGRSGVLRTVDTVYHIYYR